MTQDETTTTITAGTRLDAADAQWFAAHPGARARGRLPRTEETFPGGTDGRVWLVIVYASGEKRAVREGPIPAHARWLRFGRDGELLP